MKTAGVIAEYNPFHNGHKYHLEQTREQTGADYIIAVISGDYVQRGAPASINKYIRTEMALANGADLVLELPVYYASGSAEYFAAGAVALLDKLGVTDILSFGSECGSINILSGPAKLLACESPAFTASLQALLRQGKSYPQARSLALIRCLSVSGAEDFAAYEAAILQPNNILGIEYIKALLKRKSAILPFTLKREGAAYHEKNLPDDFCEKSSASALRLSMEQQGNLALLKKYIPASVYTLLSSDIHSAFPVTANDFSLLLKYKLLMESKKGYTGYMDVTQELSDKIRKNLNRFTNYNDFCSLLKSREITYTHISRALLHILLDMKKCALASYMNDDYISYARILGFRKTSGPLLHVIKKNSSIPLISKLADASSLLNETGNSMLEKEITASALYDSVVSNRSGVPTVSEYKKQLIIL